MKTILILTGGGLAPAFNPTIYGVVTAARKQGWRVLGGMFGWQSLLADGRHVDLSAINIEPLQNRGGTILRSSRANPYAAPDGPEQFKTQLKKLDVDAVVAIGGDDTLGAAAKLAQDGVPVIGIPKTIDNDLEGTYCTPGFPTAAARLISYIHDIKRDAAYALSRIYVIETMGFKAGWLTCASTLGGADLVLPPEWKLSWNVFTATLVERYNKNENYAVVAASHGAHFDQPLEVARDSQTRDQYGHARPVFACLPLAQKIQEKLGFETKPLYPGNWLEAGDPTARDRDLAIKLGKSAVEYLAKGEHGLMMTIERPDPETLDLGVSSKPLSAIEKKSHRPLPFEMYNKEQFLPTPQFYNYLKPLL